MAECTVNWLEQRVHVAESCIAIWEDKTATLRVQCFDGTAFERHIGECQGFLPKFHGNVMTLEQWRHPVVYNVDLVTGAVSESSVPGLMTVETCRDVSPAHYMELERKNDGGVECVVRKHNGAEVSRRAFPAPGALFTAKICCDDASAAVGVWCSQGGNRLYRWRFDSSEDNTVETLPLFAIPYDSGYIADNGVLHVGQWHSPALPDGMDNRWNVTVCGKVRGGVLEMYSDTGLCRYGAFVAEPN